MYRGVFCWKMNSAGNCSSSSMKLSCVVPMVRTKVTYIAFPKVNHQQSFMAKGGHINIPANRRVNCDTVDTSDDIVVSVETKEDIFSGFVSPSCGLSS